MKDYNYDYDSRSASEAGPYKLKGLSRGDSIAAGIILGLAGIAGATGLGNGSGTANQVAYLLEAVVSLGASFALLRSALSESENGDEHSGASANPRQIRVGELARAYNIDIFNVGSQKA